MSKKCLVFKCDIKHECVFTDLSHAERVFMSRADKLGSSTQFDKELDCPLNPLPHIYTYKGPMVFLYSSKQFSAS